MQTTPTTHEAKLIPCWLPSADALPFDAAKAECGGSVPDAEDGSRRPTLPQFQSKFRSTLQAAHCMAKQRHMIRILHAMLAAYPPVGFKPSALSAGASTNQHHNPTFCSSRSPIEDPRWAATAILFSSHLTSTNSRKKLHNSIGPGTRRRRNRWGIHFEHSLHTLNRFPIKPNDRERTLR